MIGKGKKNSNIKLEKITVNGIEMLGIESWAQLERMFLEAAKQTRIEEAKQKKSAKKPKTKKR